MTWPFYNVNPSWTLFLDRDGVINEKRDNDYVKTWEEFIFLEGAKEAIASFSKCFGRILIVTNQRGVGRQLMTAQDLENIHAKMLHEIEISGGKIDGIYVCPDLAENDVKGWRKPKAGMAFQAQKDFTDIDFGKSVVVGDSLSDMEFGRNAGMYTIWVSAYEIQPENKSLIDQQILSLSQYADILSQKRGKEE